MAKNMLKIAEVKLLSCRLHKKLQLWNFGATFLQRVAELRCVSFKLRNCDCGLKKKVAGAHLCKINQHVQNYLVLRKLKIYFTTFSGDKIPVPHFQAIPWLISLLSSPFLSGQDDSKNQLNEFFQNHLVLRKLVKISGVRKRQVLEKAPLLMLPDS